MSDDREAIERLRAALGVFARRNCENPRPGWYGVTVRDDKQTSHGEPSRPCACCAVCIARKVYDETAAVLVRDTENESLQTRLSEAEADLAMVRAAYIQLERLVDDEQARVNYLWTAMQRACNHPERWNEILSGALNATSGRRDTENEG